MTERYSYKGDENPDSLKSPADIVDANINQSPYHWGEISTQTFDTLFPKEGSMGRMLLPTQTLAGRKRSITGIESAMTPPLRTCITSTYLLQELYGQKINTIRDFFAWEFTDFNGIKQDKDKIKLKQEVPRAFTENLLPLPHARLIRKVLELSGERDALVVPQVSLEAEDDLIKVVEEEGERIKESGKGRYLKVLILLYGLHSGKGEKLGTIRDGLKFTSVENVKDTEAAALEMLNNPQTTQRFKKVIQSKN